MTNRQRLRIFLMTSAFVGGFAFAATAAELPLPPVGVTTPPAKNEVATKPAPAKTEATKTEATKAEPAKEAAKPAEPAKTEPTKEAAKPAPTKTEPTKEAAKPAPAKPEHARVARAAPRVHHVAAPAPIVVQPPPESRPIEVASSEPTPRQASRYYGYSIILGVAY